MATVPDIDPQKILLIVNTSSGKGQSITDADDYVTRRGLNSGLRLGFAFPDVSVMTWDSLRQLTCTSGTINGTSYVGKTAFTAVADAIDAAGIEMVLCSTYTPASIQINLVLSVFTVQFPLSAVLGFAGWHLSFGTTTPGVSFLTGFPFNSTSTDYSSFVNPVPFDWKAQLTASKTGTRVTGLPNGRLGCPDFNSSTNTERALAAGGTSIYDNAVTNALAQESTPVWYKPHISSSSENYSTYVPITSNQLILSYCRAQKFVTLDVTNGQDISATALFTNGLSPAQPFYAFTLASTREDSAWPASQSPVYAGGLQPLPGSWAYVWQSFAGGWSANLLAKGASGAVGTAGEPGSSGYMVPSGVLYNLVNYGLSLAAAAFTAHSRDPGNNQYWPIAQTVYGDPLMVPYKKPFTRAIAAPSGRVLTAGGAALRFE